MPAIVKSQYFIHIMHSYAYDLCDCIHPVVYNLITYIQTTPSNTKSYRFLQTLKCCVGWNSLYLYVYDLTMYNISHDSRIQHIGSTANCSNGSLAVA